MSTALAVLAVAGTPAAEAGATSAEITAAGTAPLEASSDLPRRLARLDRMSDEERTRMLHEASWERQAVFEALIRKLSSPLSEAQLHAAYLLGHYRMDQAAPHLARRIALTDERLEERSKDFWFWGRNPAAEALARIGQPSLRYLIDNLAESTDPDVLRLSAEVMLGIAGPVAPTLVEQALAGEADGKRRDRLRKSLALFAD